MHHNNSKTSIYDFSFLSPYQAQKEIIVNENINKIALLLNKSIISFSKDFNADNLLYGNLIIIPENSSEHDAKYANHILLKTDIVEYIAPADGMIFWSQQEETFILYAQNRWQPLHFTKSAESNIKEHINK